MLRTQERCYRTNLRRIREPSHGNLALPTLVSAFDRRSLPLRDGLSEGDAVVTSANFLIDAESNLRAALKGFAEAGAAQDDDKSIEAKSMGAKSMGAKP